ncbi:unnamed protein product [Staurois parvus]|uniref:Uncharacterized protein n=1 Tax=Staurois parvus TaxID=386267 RepID=A0ABN9F175_9NEOB|nr:unnamed protein product [Staurois parvus]
MQSSVQELTGDRTSRQLAKMQIGYCNCHLCSLYHTRDGLTTHGAPGQ